MRPLPAPSSVRTGSAVVASSAATAGTPVASTGAGPRSAVTVAASEALARCAAAADRALGAARRGAVVGIHDVRTTTRRARAALDAFRDEIRREERDGLRALLRGVRRAAAPLRDLDVLREALAAARLPAARRAGRASLLAALSIRRRAARVALSGALSASAHPTLAAALSRVATRLAATPSAVPFAVAGATRLPAALAPALARRARLGDDSRDAPARELHALRIDVKRARYAAESFLPAFGRPLAGFARAARLLQDRLGAIQDAEARREGVRAVLRLVPAAAGERRAAAAAAEHLDSLFDRDAERARADLPALLEATLGSKALRTLFAHLGKRAATIAVAGVAQGARGRR